MNFFLGGLHPENYSLLWLTLRGAIKQGSAHDHRGLPESARSFVLFTERWSLERSVSYLNQMAAKESGPEFHKWGRTPLYALADLDEWAKEKIGPAVLSNVEHRLLVARGRLAREINDRNDRELAAVIRLWAKDPHKW